jgi:PhnB protein
MKVNPYLNFDGKAHEAFKFYQSVLGGELSIQKMSSAPGIKDLPKEEKNLTLHVSLPIGNGQFLRASDIVKSMGHVLHTDNSNSSVFLHTAVIKP